MNQFKLVDLNQHELHKKQKVFVDISSVAGKLYIDSQYGIEEAVSLELAGMHLRGKWEIETEDVGEFDYILRLIDRQTSSTISLTFTNHQERTKLVESMEFDHPIHHVDSSPKGIQLGSILNKKTVIAGGIVGALSLAGIWSYRHFKKRK